MLTAVAVIFTADLRPIGRLANYLVFTLLVQLAYLVIIGLYAVARDRVSPALDAVFEWIKGPPPGIGNRAFAGFGLIFLVKGLSALAG